MKIAMIEPFYGGSHAQWVDGYLAHTEHTIDLFSLPDTSWKWRMDGGAIELAKAFQQKGSSYDLIVASDMLDAPTFLSLLRKEIGQTPLVMYLHENQFSYPWSQQERHGEWKRRHYGFINYRSALVADRCFFNSAYHRDCFLEDLEKELMRAPDFQNIESVHQIKEKSEVLPVGINYSRIRTLFLEQDNSEESATPVFLWNHRWDYDKGPDEFFRAMSILHKEGYDFQLIVLGEELDVTNPHFEEAKKELSEKIAHWGFAENYEQYLTLMMKADLLPVTSRHDFFGISLMEAVSCGVTPLLPKRLVYPEYFSEKEQEHYFYESFQDLLAKLRDVCTKKRLPVQDRCPGHFSYLDWNKIAQNYDKTFEECSEKSL